MVKKLYVILVQEVGKIGEVMPMIFPLVLKVQKWMVGMVSVG
jgi:hypothetical protein